MKTKKNGGYSLIELLVAVVILAIIVIPVVQSFLATMRTNQKAKLAEQATIAGQNVMEELKSSDVDTLLASVASNSGTTVTKDPVSGGQIITFVTDDIVVDNRTFQARVTLDSTADVSLTEGDGKSDNEITDYNREVLTQLYGMDQSQDAFYMQPENQDAEMAAELGCSIGDMEREITVYVTKEDDGTTAVELETLYKGNGSEQYTMPRKQCIYISKNSNTELRNIYLLFNPLYNNGFAAPRETITICNEDCLPVSAYLVKQNSDPARETGYKVNIRVQETDRTGHYEDGELKVLTSLRTNLTEQQQNVTYGIGDMFGYAGSVDIDTGSGNITYTAEQLTDCKELAGKTAGDRVYKTKVEVYEKDDAGNVLVTLTGTKEK